MGRNPIAWAAKKERAIARSSTEAEFRAIADATAELLWLQSLLGELGLSLSSAPVVYCDNLGATHYSANPLFHSRMKHVALAFHFVREQVQQGRLRVCHIPSADQLADVLTKPLPRVRFDFLLHKLGLSYRPSNLRGPDKKNNLYNI